MYTTLIVIHLVSCFLMVAVILLQSGKGAEIGAAFGGSSQTLFGSRGAATFLSKVTAVSAVVFFVTALALAMLSKERYLGSSVFPLQESGGPAAQEAVPGAAPEGAPAEPAEDFGLAPESAPESAPEPAAGGEAPAPEGP